MSNLVLDVHTADGKTDGTVELPAELFDRKVSVALLHQVVNAQLAGARQGTHSTKTRGEVSGGGKKPFRQKGTGRARQGSIRAPHFTGGGIAHGPKPRDYSQRTPKKMKAAALLGALSNRARTGRIHAITEVVAGQNPSTKAARTFLESITDRKNVLVVVGREDQTSRLSVRNLPGVRFCGPEQITTFDVLKADDVIFSVESLHKFIELKSKSSLVKKAATTKEEEK
ncbi:MULTISPECIES: 50S ribosomal protein L4 [Corynebacterium]|uniref:Large ribosomal subunit protein uL4 n=2 Tax=Corynebacterium glucuronolyticum TaxID=39791 RepID=A0AAX1L9D1_9CORY|nr:MULTISPECIES: 50S ribosomal protein L4 [Corynebacterium]EEI63498.1 50S ribosomal protein L4 [Corynebacterium glucuronolyticum ATCC 51866]OFO49510.1 50S ribosomal protein L4 [Corynebacterium sp. HMSC073D01]QRP71068.1 50S ribosomal protein L4 [Corynebacterium glucuronolyticum]